MPLVQCDLRVGLSDEQKVDLGLGITEVFERVLGIPRRYVFVSLRETEAENFVEAGEVAPSYDEAE
jgi:4-oxalocrotonate tautomerase family enzyme